MLVAFGGSPESSGGLPHSSPHGGLVHQPARVDHIRRLGRRAKQERELDAIKDHPIHTPRARRDSCTIRSPGTPLSSSPNLKPDAYSIFMHNSHKYPGPLRWSCSRQGRPLAVRLLRSR